MLADVARSVEPDRPPTGDPLADGLRFLASVSPLSRGGEANAAPTEKRPECARASVDPAEALAASRYGVAWKAGGPVEAGDRIGLHVARQYSEAEAVDR